MTQTRLARTEQSESPGLHALADMQRASLNSDVAAEAVLPGDVLRAVTATNFVYPTRALWGAQAPERHIVSEAG